ncbi:MAG: hypothetical protein HDT04_05015 [Bacteroidales bacterium]|nr:hypothetical protein [Bacteroidales bacterium]
MGTNIIIFSEVSKEYLKVVDFEDAALSIHSASSEVVARLRPRRSFN